MATSSTTTPNAAATAKPKSAAASATKKTLSRVAAAPKKPVGAPAAAKSAESKPAASGTPATGDKPKKSVAKPKKPKLVRDSFTLPKNEYQTLQDLKERSIGLGHAAKKSEILRAGIARMAALSDAALLKALRAVPALKTGRPKSGD